LNEDEQNSKQWERNLNQNKQRGKSSHQEPPKCNNDGISFKIPISFLVIKIEASEQLLNISIRMKQFRLFNIQASSPKEKKKLLFQKSFLVKDLIENYETVKKIIDEKISSL
jgi:hypothetical protein